jgi:hypothetical protein
MKKTFLAFCLLITAYTFCTAGQPAKNELVAPTDTETVAEQVADAATDTTKQSLEEYLMHFSAWASTDCAKEGLALIAQGRDLNVSLVNEFKDLPTPTTEEGIKAWTDKISTLVGGLGSVLVVLLTWALSLFKKDPEKTITAVQKVINTIRTRYLVFGSALVVTIIGVVMFNDGSLGLLDILKSVGAFLGVTIGSMGIQNFMKMLGFNWFEAKKVAETPIA